MKFNDHHQLDGMHSFLSASKWHWVNYTPEHLDDIYRSSMAAQLGTELHALASDLIKHGVKLPRNKKTLNQFVNDAIGWKMASEQVLFYSMNAFGTADAISFDGKLLRIHDLKTGVIPAHMEQLEIYASYFCLEYDVKPEDINMILRIYQNDDIVEIEPEPQDIRDIMGKIVLFDKRIEQLKQEGV